MSNTPNSLPQLSARPFLTDSGLETTLIFHDGYDLPDFAAFVLLDDEVGRQRLLRYFREHAAIAAANDIGFIYEAPTWRASADWGARLAYDAAALVAVNRSAIEMLVGLRREDGEAGRTSVVSGCIGPRGDGYDASARMSAAQARDYHRAQLSAFAQTEADMAHAMTINYPAEGVGIVKAAQDVAMPVAISFTVETDGVLPDGTPLAVAVEQVEEATGGAAAYFGINCAHPTHFSSVLEPGYPWLSRLRGVRANASTLSHPELDDAAELDSGNPDELAAQYTRLRAQHPNLTVLGGCCGTDLRHVERIAATLSA